MARVADLEMERVRVHAHDGFVHGLGVIGEIDAIAQRLAHLSFSVGTRQSHAGLSVREDDGRLDKGLAVDPVERTHYFDALLDHRFLVFSGRDMGGSEGRDVGRLGNRVGEETDRNAFPEAAQADFGLHGRVPLDSAHSHEVHVILGEFGKFSDPRLDKDSGLGRVKAYGQVVEGYFDNVLAHLLRIVEIVGEGLDVSYEDEHLVVVTFVLDFHPPAEAAYIVSEMEPSRRTVSCQYDFSHFSFLV